MINTRGFQKDSSFQGFDSSASFIVKTAFSREAVFAWVILNGLPTKVWFGKQWT
jgi:hypothetical protein